MKIALIGAPCSGKTTTLNRLVEELNYPKITEYATTFLEQYGSISDFNQQYHVTHTQMLMENDVRNVSDSFITEAPIYTGFIYQLYYFDEQFRESLYELNSLRDENKYDKIFHLKSLPEWEDNGIRYQKDINEAREIGEHLKREGKNWTRDFYEVPILSLDERIQYINQRL